MKELELHGFKSDFLIQCLRIYAGFGVDIDPPDLSLRMGGGTALAMHWQHRHSTDIDLAMPEADLRAITNRNWRDISKSLARMEQDGEIVNQVFKGRFIAWEYTGGREVSLSGVGVTVPRADPTHKERHSGLPLSPIADILRGKLQGRTLGKGKTLVRDGYDLCTAHDKDPEVFYGVINEVNNDIDARDQLRCLVKTIQATPHRIIEGRLLMDPIDAKLARDPWGRFAEIVMDYMGGGDNDPLDHNPGLGR